VTLTPDSVAEHAKAFPQLEDIVAAREIFWVNPGTLPFDDACQQIEFTREAEADAAERLERFRPYIARVFPETQQSGGLIESDLVDASTMQAKLAAYCGLSLPGRLMIKLDSHLPISGSIKARGGIYEVLKYAETLAAEQGRLCQQDDYSILDSDEFRSFFGRYSIVVGSTGNLGMSIGIMGASFGFKVTVHMSADARQWKKNLLRARGVTVLEYKADYGHAVAQGRAEAESDPDCHFVDDEASTDLFLGYAVAARRLKKQLDDQGIRVDAEHPLFVYLPCGVGGGPGGVSFGLKLAFGDHAHCIFVEPTHAPAVLLGMGTGLHEKISAQDVGLDGLTAADGLAVSRPSGMVCRAMAPLIDAIFTLEDDELYKLLVLVADAEGIRLEPSAVAGFAGVSRVLENAAYLRDKGLAEKMSEAVHLVWATGGSLVPDSEWAAYYRQGEALFAIQNEY
jgi:D-serine dehydratase